MSAGSGGGSAERCAAPLGALASTLLSVGRAVAQASRRINPKSVIPRRPDDGREDPVPSGSPTAVTMYQSWVGVGHTMGLPAIVTVAVGRSPARPAMVV